MYMLLSADCPFWSDNPAEMEYLICNSKLKFDYPAFTHVPKSAKDLISKMLDKNAARRPSARECLDHDFFN